MRTKGHLVLGKYLAFSIMFVLTIAAECSALSINNVVGTIADRQTIEIDGAGFGANGPTVVLFDDFENGTNGTKIPTGAGKPQVGDWAGTSDANWPKYSNSYKVSGNLAWKGDYSANYRQDLWPAFSATRYVFISWWQLIPSGTAYPGEGGTNVNWKTIWIQHNNSTTDDDLTPLFFNTNAASTLSDILINGNDGVYNRYLGVGDIQGKGTWKRYSWYMYGGASSDGVVKFWQFGSQKLNASGATVLKDTNGWTDIHVNGYGRQTSNCTPYYDDVYVAIGPYAQARVEIGNASTYSASTNLTIVTTTSWSDAKITGTVRQGSFAAGTTAYLYVIDANGNVSTGKQITFGSSGSSGGSSGGSGVVVRPDSACMCSDSTCSNCP